MKAKTIKTKKTFQKKNVSSKKNKNKQRNKKNNKKHNEPKIQPTVQVEDNEESDNGEDMLGMVEKDDLSFLQKSIINHSYSILNQIRVNRPTVNKKKKRKNCDREDTLEEGYEKDNIVIDNGKKFKSMLPVKTKEGVIQKSIEVEEEEDDISKENAQPENETEKNEDQDESSDEEDDIDWSTSVITDNGQLTTAALMAARQAALQKLQLRLGVLCSGLLENPEGKIINVMKILKMLEDDRPEIWISTRKLTILSLLEVFKDILPMYQIKTHETGDVKLKKMTFRLVKYEDALLIGYKKYLQKLDKFASVLTKKWGNKKKVSEAEQKLGVLAVRCFCELIVAHPYFNFSKNIVQALIPFLNNRHNHVREMVRDAIVKVFKDDKKGEITLEIVRKINNLVKLKLNNIRPEVLQPLLALKLKNVSLDKIKETEVKQKKLNARKQRLINLKTKKDNKKQRQLQELEKELLETKAEENEQTKQKHLTDTLNAVFVIYFRVLKQSPNSKVLEVTLEGLAKFAHSINLEYYSELVDVINNLIENETLTNRQQLHCIQTVFTILSGVGEVLNIDPLRFYTHFYRILLACHASKNHRDLSIMLGILETILIKRRKKVTQRRMLAFIKRLATLALQTLQNGSMGCLAVIKTAMQQCKHLDILLDCDSTLGDGQYSPECDEPEYANTGSTALWELILLQRHFHPVVRKMATHIISGVPATGEGSLPLEIGKLSPANIFEDYDPSEMAFKPSIKPPLHIKEVLSKQEK